jgi:hypothetical protein
MVTPAGANVCRRCKKKRQEDEPIETARYRTCKPCREIERKRKRLKKLNFVGVDAETAAAAAAELSRKNAAEIEQSIINIATHVSKTLPQEHQHQHQQHVDALQHHIHQGPPQIQQYDQSTLKEEEHQPTILVREADAADKEIPIDENLLKEGAMDEDQKASLTKSPHDLTDADKKVDASNIFAVMNSDGVEQQQQGEDASNARTPLTEAQSPSILDNLNHCLYCGARRSIHDDGRYQLCGNCVSNPLEKANVFDDFESYLDRIEHGKNEDLKNVIFIKKFEDEELIPSFTHDNLDQILIKLQDSFIDRIMQRSGFKFSKTSSNLSAKPFPKSIKLLYKCKQDIKTVHKSNTPSSPGTPISRRLKTENCNSNFYVSYDVIGKNLSIKFNHNTHKTFIERLYSQEFIGKVVELLRSYVDLNEIFDKLFEVADSESLKNELEQTKRINFIKDFSTMFV